MHPKVIEIACLLVYGGCAVGYSVEDEQIAKKLRSHLWTLILICYS